MDGSMPTVAGWTIIAAAVLVAAVLATWGACWWRGHAGCLCIPRRRLHAHEMVCYHSQLTVQQIRPFDFVT